MSSSKEKTDGPSLLPPEKATSEESQRRKYVSNFLTLVLLQGPGVAWSLFFGLTVLNSKVSNDILVAKFQFINDYQLYYVYIAVFQVYLVSLVLVTNSNGARGPTCLDRPDQHIYRVVGKSDLVLLANEGVAGRFNRAQRGSFNMQESLPLFLVHVLLVAPVFGPLVPGILVPVYAYGRIQLAHAYKENAKERIGGFLWAMIGEHGMAAMVLVVILKSILGSKIPIP